MDAIEALDTESPVSDITLDRNPNSCHTVQNLYSQGNIASAPPPEFMEDGNKGMLVPPSYEPKIQRAKASIAAARNIFNCVSINALPVETLAHIFQLVASSRICNDSTRRNSSRYHKFIYLTQVCSHWRQIAIDTHSLWSHVDFSSQITIAAAGDNKYFTRAKAFVDRAGDSLLDIHIIERLDNDYSAADLTQFLAPIATRIRSLDIALCRAWGINSNLDTFEFERLVLFSCFSNCVPGTLGQVKLVIRGETRNHRPQPIRFVRYPNWEVAAIFPSDLPKCTMEDLWLHVTVLRLGRLFPNWASKAYHGLVELRLPATRTLLDSCSISVSGIRAILIASPKLRVLQFGSVIRCTDPLVADTPPIRLDDLEVVIARPLGRRALGSLLRLLAPGSKPLRVSIEFSRTYMEAEDHLADIRIKEFLARSNVTQLQGGYLTGYPQVANLLNSVPHIQVLVLQSFIGVMEQFSELDTEVSLACLHIHRSSEIRWDALGQFIKTYRVQTLVLWRCTITLDGEHSARNQEDCERELSTLCPVVKLVPSDEPDPFDPWDLDSEM